MKFKFCTNCGRKIPKSTKFCPFCGASQEPKATHKSQSKKITQGKKSGNKQNVKVQSKQPNSIRNIHRQRNQQARPKFNSNQARNVANNIFSQVKTAWNKAMQAINHSRHPKLILVVITVIAIFVGAKGISQVHKAALGSPTFRGFRSSMVANVWDSEDDSENSLSFFNQDSNDDWAPILVFNKHHIGGATYFNDNDHSGDNTNVSDILDYKKVNSDPEDVNDNGTMFRWYFKRNKLILKAIDGKGTLTFYDFKKENGEYEVHYDQEHMSSSEDGKGTTELDKEYPVDQAPSTVSSDN